MNPTPSHYPARYWHTMEDGRLECRLCPRFCHLRDGQRGFCYVRQNIDHKMVLTTYGRSSGFCADPIEKKPLNHFYPGTSIMSFGTAGCNLGCKFCQNWGISKSRDMDTLSKRAEPSDIARAAKEAGCQSVAFTYNDPVIFAEYVIDTAIACKALDIKTCAVSAGYITEEGRSDFFEHLDAANIDLKAFTQHFYKKLCFANLAPVLETLQYIRHKTNTWLEITTLLIPGQNDSEDEITKLVDWIAIELGLDVPLHFTAFHPDFKMTDLPRTPAPTLLNARKIALQRGLHYVYVGNIHHTPASSTYCPKCQQILIERDWYQLGDYQLDDQGRCNRCQTTIAGHFGKDKGRWQGQRRRY